MSDRNFCPRCHANVPKGTRYCYFCGCEMPGQSPVKKFFMSLLQCLGYYGFFIGVQSLVSVACTLIITLLPLGLFGSFDEDAAYDAVYRFLPEIGILSAIVTLLGYFLFFKIRKKSLFKEIKVRSIRPTTCVAMLSFGMTALFIVSIGLTFLYILFPELSSYSNSEELEHLMDGSNPVVEFINISIVTGIIEEVLFRGLIYTTMKKAMPKALAIILSSVFFGIAHMNIEQFFYTSLLGLLMVLVYERYGTIFAPIIVHATFNGSNYVLDALNFKYDEPYFAIFVLAIAIFILTLALVFFTERVPRSRIKYLRKSENETL